MSWGTCPAYGTTEWHHGVCDVCGGCDDATPCAPEEEVEVVTEARGNPPRDITFARRRSAATEYGVAVNGQLAKIAVAPDTPLSAIVTDAILTTGNERWGGEDRWECRDSRGVLLDDSTRLGDIAPNVRGVCVWVQLKPGVFA